MAGLSLDCVLVPDFALEAQAGEPCDGVEEPEEDGRIFAQLALEGGRVETIEELEDVSGEEGEGSLVNFGGPVLADKIGEGFMTVPHLFEPILVL